ncbi:MAG: GTP cyclohydrolase, FolE2/MptA family, partial [Pigmentiphaga sp.]
MNSPIDSILVMPDVQSSLDTRQIAIQRVGIRDVRQPMLVATPEGSLPTVATWTLTVALPAEQKGTHMSRFMGLLEYHRQQPIDLAGFQAMAAEMLLLLQAERGDLTAEFPYFIQKTAPISGVKSLMDYRVQWQAVATSAAVRTE